MGSDVTKKTLLTPMKHSSVCKAPQLYGIWDRGLSDGGPWLSGNKENDRQN